jgi:hypothetical protein
MGTERAIRVGVLLGLVVFAAGSGGCSTMSNTEKGVGLGGLVGAGLGTGIGAITGNPKTGAVVGTLAGAGVGGMVGNGMDRQDQQRRDVLQAQANAQAQAQVQARRMGMMDVVDMAQKGHDEQVIINQIRTTGSTFQLSQTDLDYLKTYNVPPRVILEMQAARVTPAPTRVIVREPAPVVIHERPAPVYVVPGPPPPRPVVFVGGHYCH